MSPPTRISLVPGFQGSPERQAREDWKVQAARPWPLESGTPLARLFGVQGTRWSWRAPSSPKALAYGRAYNAELAALVKKSGPPAWAPGAALPSPKSLRRALDEALPVLTLEQLEALELGALLGPLHHSALAHPAASGDVLPLALARRLEPEGWLLLGSLLSPDLIRLDVVDVLAGEWLLSEECARTWWSGALPGATLDAATREALRTRVATWRTRDAEAREQERVRHEALQRESARLQSERQARDRAEAERVAEQVAALLAREPACPHCQVRSRHFRPSRDATFFVCPSCHRSSDAAALGRPA